MSLIKEAIIIRVPIIFVLNLAFHSNSKIKTEIDIQVSTLALFLKNHLSFQVHRNGSILKSYWTERSEVLIIKMLVQGIHSTLMKEFYNIKSISSF